MKSIRIGFMKLLALALCAVAAPCLAAQAGTASSGHVIAIAFFFVFILMTLCITYWAAGRTKSKHDFYAAGGKVTTVQNGLAIAGDFMSAGALLGLTALVYSKGFDGLVYAVGYATGMPVSWWPSTWPTP